MAVVEQLDVSLAPPKPRLLLGSAIQTPGTGDVSETYAVKVAGWALGREAPVAAVEAVQDDRVIQSTPAQLGRPRVAARFPGAAGADHCGFVMLVSVLGMPPDFAFELRAVLSDQTRIPLATIRGRRRLVQSSFTAALQPLMVTSLGRTGTTWLMRLLAEHPAIVAYRRYPYEIRTGKYWLHMLKVLSQPADNTHTVGQPNHFHEETGAVGPNPFYASAFTEYPAVETWSGRDYVERLATFCQQSIEDWYQRVAESQGQANAVFFAEKHLPDAYPRLLWELYPAAREVILVRDFRDMAASILAFNAKRGNVDFGRDRASSDEQFIDQLSHGARRLLDSWRARADRAHLVRYEDLISSPIDTLRSLVTYLGLEATAATIEGMIARASRETPEMGRHQTSASPAASIGRWERDLSPPLQAVARETFDGILTDFGYSSERCSSLLIPYRPSLLKKAERRPPWGAILRWVPGFEQDFDPKSCLFGSRMGPEAPTEEFFNRLVRSVKGEARA